MKEVISSAVKSFGVLFCPEHDQEEIPIVGVKSLRLDGNIHCGNMSKVVYYSDTNTVTELTSGEVKKLMTPADKSIEECDDKSIKEWNDYKDRFSVIRVKSKEGFFKNEYHIVCVHL